jgi:hypothetical protein
LSGHAEDIGQYVAQLYVGVFQNLLYPILFRRRMTQQPFAPPRQIAQLADGARWNEAGLNHGVAQS